MVKFMTNIPRRKIYERMLVYEDGLIDMQILLFNEKNFENFQSKFNEEAWPQIVLSYKQIKALFLMFLENRKYEEENKFEEDLEFLTKEKKIVNEHLERDKNLGDKFFLIIKKLDKIVHEVKEIKTFEEAKKIYKVLDDFNHIIPLKLEIRRDKMR